jgi:hypothetical protein
MAEEIDLEALAVPRRAKPKGDISPKQRVPYGEGYRSRFTAAERRARRLPLDRAKAERMNAARGVTLWHKITMAVAPGEWFTTVGVWKRIPGFRKSRISNCLALMLKWGIVERERIEGVPDVHWTINKASGKRMGWKRARWLYRLTGKGLAHAREGRLRAMLE